MYLSGAPGKEKLRKKIAEYFTLRKQPSLPLFAGKTAVSDRVTKLSDGKYFRQSSHIFPLGFQRGMHIPIHGNMTTENIASGEGISRPEISGLPPAGAGGNPLRSRSEVLTNNPVFCKI